MARALRGIDISSWNTNDIDWAWVANHYEFCIIKCTGGMGYRNPYYSEQLAGARGVGLIVGHYHYAVESSLSTGNPMGPGGEAEALRFLDEADIREGELICLDLEDKQLPDDAEQWTLDFCQKVEEVTNTKPFIYSYKAFMEERNLTTEALSEYPLWYAFYWDSGKDSPIPRTIGAWEKITIWQFSGSTPIPQMPSNPVDENLFWGTREELLAYGMPGVTQGAVNMSPIVTPETNWGGEGVILAHLQVILAQNADTGVMYFNLIHNGVERGWDSLTKPS